MQPNKTIKKKLKTPQKGKTIKVPLKENNTAKVKTINKFYIYGLIVLSCFVLYGNTIPCDYALDDAMVINSNKFTQKGIAGINDIFSYDSFKGFNEKYLNSVSGGRYRPLSIATFAIEHSFFGNNPHVSHFINILLYALCCVLIFIIFSKLLKKFPKSHWYLSIPFIATILFIAHPIHTEVVANIKGRDEIMSLLFSLLAMLFLLNYLDSKKRIHLIYSAASYFLALLSKEIALVFIVIIPLSFYFFTDNPVKKIIISTIPLMIIIIAFIALRQIVISRTATTIIYTNDIMNNSFAAMNISQKYATIVFTLGLYIKLLFFPHPLTWDYYPYHIQIMEWSNSLVLLSLIICLLLIIIAIKGLKNKNFISYCVFLFFIPLSLTSNILFSVGTFMSERFIFVSSLGFTLIIAYFITVKPAKFFKIIFNKPIIILIPVLFLYSFKTIDRNKAWKNDKVLIETDVKTSANSAKSNSEYGKILYELADTIKDQSQKVKFIELTLQYLEKSFEIDMNNEATNFMLGTIYGRYKNDLDKSIYYLNNSMNLDPNRIDAYNNLGTAYGMKKQYDKALEVFEKALKVSPNNFSVLNNLALTYKMIGQNDKAEQYAKKAKEIEATKK